MKKHIYFYRDKIKLIHNNFIFVKNYIVLKKSNKLNNTLRQKVIFKSYSKSLKINKNNIRKFCILTGRLRSILGNSRLNRLNFRELASKSNLPGIFKR